MLGRRQEKPLRQDYASILRRYSFQIPEPPKWFDLTSVPRYCDFAPNKIANIYAKECALMEIECQSCRTKFLVAIDTRLARSQISGVQGDTELADLIRSEKIHYGDPPNIRCCPAGPSMNSIPIRVLEYWHRHQKTLARPGSSLRHISPDALHWQRDPGLEIEIDKACLNPN